MQGTAEEYKTAYQEPETVSRAAAWSDMIRDFIRAYFAPSVPAKNRGDVSAVDAAILQAPQNRWTACMMQAGASLFSGRELFVETNRDKDFLPGGTFAPGNKAGTLDNSKLKDIADIYIYLCSEYDKYIRLSDYIALCNAAYNTFMQDTTRSASGVGVTAGRAEIVKTIERASEGSLENFLATGKRNPVSILGILNHRHRWNMPGVTRETVGRVLKGADALPSLGTMHNAAPMLQDGENAEKSRG